MSIATVESAGPASGAGGAASRARPRLWNTPVARCRQTSPRGCAGRTPRPFSAWLVRQRSGCRAGEHLPRRITNGVINPNARGRRRKPLSSAPMKEPTTMSWAGKQGAWACAAAPAFPLIAQSSAARRTQPCRRKPHCGINATWARLPSAQTSLAARSTRPPSRNHIATQGLSQ